MSKQTIWNFFKLNTDLSDEAIAGIMGNFEAESNNEACRVQGDFTSDRRISKQYAQNVNSGALPNWHIDSKGFGLAQWTFPSRKENLKRCCESYGAGIEDETAQLRFFLSEMQQEPEYISTWRNLLACHSIYDAASLVCCYYEKPAVKNIQARADYGQTIYKKFHGSEVIPEPDPEPAPAPSPSPVPSDDRTDKIIALLEQIIILLKG